jgi:hypothetical protein
MNEQFEEDLSDLVYPYKKAIQNALDDNEDPDAAIEGAQYLARDLMLLREVLAGTITSFFIAKTKKVDGAELLYNYLSNMQGILSHEIFGINKSIKEAGQCVEESKYPQDPAPLTKASTGVK